MGRMRITRRVNGDQRGLTAIELAVVVAILAVLAAIVAGNTAGMSTSARGSSMATDRAEVQKAVDNYRGQHFNSAYPVTGSLTVLTQDVAIVFTSVFTPNEVGAVGKKFVPDFLQNYVKHWNETNPVTTSLAVWVIDKDGQVKVNLTKDQY